MPYANGETPVVGDYVKNKWGTPGTVTRVHEARDGHEDISVRWDDGGTEADLGKPSRAAQISLFLPWPFLVHPQECRKHRQSRYAWRLPPVVGECARHLSDDQHSSESSGLRQDSGLNSY